MTIEQDIAAWVRTRPEWQRDVLARLCRNEPIDQAAIEQIASSLIAGESRQSAPILLSDIPSGATSTELIQLRALRDIKGVNALAPNQELTFADSGLTVIYGDNASGKSGYARLLRKAVAARVQSDVLGNVFAANELLEQCAIIEYTVGNGNPPQRWKWSDATSAELAQVHFFDSECGKAYISTASEISYQPSALSLLDRLAEVCGKVRTALDNHLRANIDSRPALPAVAEGTRAAVFLASLDASTTSAEIDVAARLDANANEELGKLLAEEARLRASDPAKERQRLTTLSANLTSVANRCDQVAGALSQQGVAELVNKYAKVEQLRAAAQIASSNKFEEEPFVGVGTETWRALWQAARSFSEAEAYHGHDFPVTSSGSRCVLCQQPLAAEGAQRIERFHAFMSDTTERDARAAEKMLREAREALVVYQTLPTAVTSAMSQIRSTDEALADSLDEWLNNATRQVAVALAWLDKNADEIPSHVTANPGDNLKARARELITQAQIIDSSTFAANLQDVSRRVRELQATTALTEGKELIRQEVARLAARRKIEDAKKFTDTGGITHKASELTKRYVTSVVRDHFTREAERLDLRRITLDPKSGRKGILEHIPALLGASSPTPVTRVLSEGEQTALELAGFITEVEFDFAKSAVLFDDPVTSLDHVRRSIVAQRLVQLAKERQVIVFTHEVTFVGDLVKHADEERVSVAERRITRKGDYIGICSEKFPWKAKDVKTRSIT
jgi:ABC-type phosphate/phosphonate transport system ATPase subunit